MDNEGILPDQEQESRFSDWHQNNFKYVNMGPTAWFHKAYFLVREHKQIVLFALLFFLVFIGFMVDISHNSRLNTLEAEHGSGYDFFDYDYDVIDADIMVNIDVLGKYGQECHPFFCPGEEYCYCIADQFANFVTANQSCVENFSGELVQFKNTNEENNLLNKMWRFNSYRKNSFWIGMTMKKGEKAKWINCTNCDPVENLNSNVKKHENLTFGDHSCLIMSERILQKYPCVSPRLSHWEKKYLAKDESQRPYWMNNLDTIRDVYGLQAFCECSTDAAAGRIEGVTKVPLTVQSSRSAYVLTKEKFFDQANAEKACGEVSDCYLISINDPAEQRDIQKLEIWKAFSPSIWIGGKQLGKEYRWTQASCTNQFLIFPKTVEWGTLCYSIGDRIAGSGYKQVIHARDCDDYQSFGCQIRTHRLMAAKAATDKQISLRLIQQLGQRCELFDCLSNVHCYCVLGYSQVSKWRDAVYACGVENMDLVVVNDQKEFDFLTKSDHSGLRGYLAAHDFHNEKKLTWVSNMELATTQRTVKDDYFFKDWTNSTGGCLILERGESMFALQNCEVPAQAICEFDVAEYVQKWESREDDYDY